MKKYTLFFITIALIVFTIITYIYDSTTAHAPEIIPSQFHINSSIYGEIKEMVWLNNSVSIDNALIILSSKEKQGISYSYLHYLNILDETSVLLAEFPSHTTLDNVIFFDRYITDDIVTAYDKGFVRVSLHRDNDPEGGFTSSYHLYEVEGFENADSMEYNGLLFYSKPEDHLIHSRNFTRSPLPFRGNQPNTATFYRKPFRIINSNLIDQVLTYTKVNNNRLDLYSMEFDGSPLTQFNLPFIKNVISAQSVGDGFGFIGMSKSQNPSTLDVFMVRRTINLIRQQDSHILDTIPYNHDQFGGIPAMDSTTWNEDYSLVYTSYDENHHGKLKVASYRQEPKTIIEDKNLYGPVRITRKKLTDDGERIKQILYFTYGANGLSVKVCDLGGNLIKDITHLIR